MMCINAKKSHNLQLTDFPEQSGIISKLHSLPHLYPIGRVAIGIFIRFLLLTKTFDQQQVVPPFGWISLILATLIP